MMLLSIIYQQSILLSTILFFKGGEIVDKNVGVAPKAELAKKIDALL